jgi:hypothetical protein
MTSDDFLRRFRRAGRDPIVQLCGVGMFLADLLFFGAPAHAVWNWCCERQNARYRQLVPLPPRKVI